MNKKLLLVLRNMRTTLIVFLAFGTFLSGLGVCMLISGFVASASIIFATTSGTFAVGTTISFCRSAVVRACQNDDEDKETDETP